MKKILLILLFIAPFLLQAQTNTKDFTWDIITNTSGTKNQLYLKARDWAFNILKNPKAAIQIQDSSAGKILIHTVFDANDDYGGTISCTLEVDVKDDKFRFRSYDYYYYLDVVGKYSLAYSECPFKLTFWGKSRLNNLWIGVQNEAINETKTLYDLLVNGMKQQDNW